MYLRDGKPMQEPEEGAAYFDPAVHVDLGLIPPRTMGLQPGMLTRGFVPVRGFGADAAVETTAPGIMSTWTPWLVGAAAAVGGFFLVRSKR